MSDRMRSSSPVSSRTRQQTDESDGEGEVADAPPVRHSIGDVAIEEKPSAKRKERSGEDRDDDEEDAADDRIGEDEGKSDDEGEADDEREDDTERPAKKKLNLDKSMEARLERAGTRQSARYEGEFRFGHYNTPGGIIGLSRGRAQDLKVTSRKEDHADESYGSNPAYADIESDLTVDHAPNVLNDVAMPNGSSARQKLAVGMSVGLIRAEDYRAPGYQKYLRAAYRRWNETRKAEDHPLKESNNPARTSAADARELMAGTLDDRQKGVADYMSESSEDEDPDGLDRSGTLEFHQDHDEDVSEGEDK